MCLSSCCSSPFAVPSIPSVTATPAVSSLSISTTFLKVLLRLHRYICTPTLWDLKHYTVDPASPRKCFTVRDTEAAYLKTLPFHMIARYQTKIVPNLFRVAWGTRHSSRFYPSSTETSSGSLTNDNSIYFDKYNISGFNWKIRQILL